MAVLALLNISTVSAISHVKIYLLRLVSLIHIILIMLPHCKATLLILRQDDVVGVYWKDGNTSCESYQNGYSYELTRLSCDIEHFMLFSVLVHTLYALIPVVSLEKSNHN